MHTIYLLKNELHVPFYVGRMQNVRNRLYQHKQTFGKSTTITEIITTDNKLHAMELESIYINIYLKRGYKLVNKHNSTYFKNQMKILVKIIESKRKYTKKSKRKTNKK